MIDLHCHILPGLDDGAPDHQASVELARASAAEGIEAIAATPHIRSDHPLSIGELTALRAEVNRVISEAGIALRVVAGGELALSEAADLSDGDLASICLGDGDYLLVESPYTDAPELVERGLFALQARGFRTVLAHPERSPCFLRHPALLADVVGRGVLCSVTALSFTGRFGAPARKLAFAMLGDDLVHNIASDAHDTESRPPGLLTAYDALEEGAAWATPRWRWLTEEVPAAILAGHDLPPAPAVSEGDDERRVARWLRGFGARRSRA